MGQFFGAAADTPTSTDAQAEKTDTVEASPYPYRGSDADRWPCIEGVQTALCGPRPITREPVASVESSGQGPPSPSSLRRDQSRKALQLADIAQKPVAPPPLCLRQRSAPVEAAPRPPSLSRAVSELSLRALLIAGRQPFTETTLKRLIPGNSTSDASINGKVRVSPLVVAASPTAKAPGSQQDTPASSVKIEKTQEESAPLSFFGTDIGTADLLPGMLPLACSKKLCLICQEDVDEVFLPDRLCQLRACNGAFCRRCLEIYYTSKVEESRYAVPFIRCPTCKGYVRSASWRGCVEDRVYRQMRQSCVELLNLRCIECDEPGTLLEDGISSPEAREESLNVLRSDFTEAQLHELEWWWSLYSRGEADAAQVCSLIEPSHTASDDGVPSQVLRKRAQMLAKLIEDPARRTVFQLGFLRRWPKTWTTCCSIPHCFKCKVGSHHQGTSCEEVQRRQVQDESMQFCPGCNVATMKSEGCNHMICICGEEWTWQGEERWVDDWVVQPELSDSASHTSSDD